MNTFDDYQKIKVLKGKYPNLYILDEKWFIQQKEKYQLKIDTTTRLFENGNIDVEHSQKTLLTILSIVKKIEDISIFAVGRERNNQFDSLPKGNTPEALFSITLYDLKKGDVLIVNLETNNKPIIISKFMSDVLDILINDREIVVIIAAGNANKDLKKLRHSSIIVGSINIVDNKIQEDSNYGETVTCYAISPIQLGDNISFSESSAATAQITGLVMLMQKYAFSKRRFLTHKEIKDILKISGKQISINNKIGNIPLWDNTSLAINALLD